MAFIPKDWRNAAGPLGGGDETTPISAAALEDMETRLGAYTDTRVDPVESGGPVIANATNFPGLDPTGVADSTAALLAFFTAAAARGRGFIPAGHYKHGDIQIPPTAGNAGGMVVDCASPYLTKLEHTGSGFGFTFGDSGTFSNNRQEIRRGEIIGNANSLGAVKMNHTRWCGVKENYIHGFTNVAAKAVLVDSADANYYNEIKGNWFDNNRCHIGLVGDPSGIGANSNYVSENVFGAVTGSYAIVVDGGDTNRIFRNEFNSATQAASIRFENAVAINNRVKDNQFDGPVKAWEVAGSSVSDTHFLDNTGTTAIEASTDLGTNSVRDDVRTRNARVAVYRSASLSIPNNAITTVTFNSEDYDPLGMHDPATNSERLTALIAGYYRISANIQFAANAVGVRMVRVTKNGTTPIIGEVDVDPPADGTSVAQVACDFPPVLLAKDDFVICRVYQVSTAALNINSGNTPGSRFSMERIG